MKYVYLLIRTVNETVVRVYKTKATALKSKRKLILLGHRGQYRVDTYLIKG